MALMDDIVQDVANTNFKVVASAASVGLAQALSLAAQNAAANQQRNDMIMTAYLGEGLVSRAGADPSEAAAIKKITEADLARTLSELGGLVASLQQMIKGAQTTPPPTA